MQLVCSFDFDDIVCECYSFLSLDPRLRQNVDILIECIEEIARRLVGSMITSVFG